MKDEKKKLKQGNKIVPFEINDEIFMDPDIDQMVKESLIQEADELEAELNTDPKLTGVGASDDLLQSIVGKLKEQRIWEEESGDNGNNADSGNGADKGQETVGAALEMRKRGAESSTASEGIQCEAGGDAESALEKYQCEPEGQARIVLKEVQNKTGEKADIVLEINQGEVTEAADSTSKKIRCETEKESETILEKDQYENAREENAALEQAQCESDRDAETTSEKIQRGIGEEINAVQRTVRHETDVEMSSEPGVSLEELYSMLPETDRRALELGREVEQRQQRKAARRRKRQKALRYGGTVAAALAVVFGLGMTSEANRRLVQKAWDMVAANFNFHVQMDYTGDDDQVRSKSREEVAAVETISENLGVATISLEVLPKGMEYYDYEIAMDNMEAVLFYTYEDTIFTVTMINMDIEGSVYYMMDESAELLKTITTEQDFEARVWETNQTLDEEHRAYIAEIDYEDCRYILNGMISLEDMEKIIKNSYIL